VLVGVGGRVPVGVLVGTRVLVGVSVGGGVKGATAGVEVAVAVGVAVGGPAVGPPIGGVDVGVGDTVGDGLGVAVSVDTMDGGDGGVAVGDAPGCGVLCFPTTIAPHGPGSTTGLFCKVARATASAPASRLLTTHRATHAITAIRRLACVMGILGHLP
jgi:hypothetical protein